MPHSESPFVGPQICTEGNLEQIATGKQPYDPDADPATQRLPKDIVICAYVGESQLVCGAEILCDGVSISSIGASCLLQTEFAKFDELGEQ
jgi:hypothetical protein